MESWSSREPLPVAEVREINLLNLRDELIRCSSEDYDWCNRTFTSAVIPNLKAELGLEDLPICPFSFRLLGQSNRLTGSWHFDGGLPYDDPYDDPYVKKHIPAIAIFASSHPTEVVCGDIPISPEGWHQLGPKDRTVNEAKESKLVEVYQLKPNILYLLQPGTIHRKPSIVGKGTMRLFGRWSGL